MRVDFVKLFPDECVAQNGLRFAGGPKLLNWVLPGRGSNLLKSRRKVLYVYPRSVFTPVAKLSLSRGSS